HPARGAQPPDAPPDREGIGVFCSVNRGHGADSVTKAEVCEFFSSDLCRQSLELHPEWVSSRSSTQRTPIMTTPTAPPTTAPAQTIQQGPALTVTGPQRERFDEILTSEAIAFLTELHHRFANRRHDRLADRMRRRFEIGSGHDPQFRDDTKHIRDDVDWRVAGAGPGL